MSELIFYLRGAFDGDGHYYNKNTIQINVCDIDFLEYIKEVIKKEFNQDVKILNHIKAHRNSQAQYRINFYLKKGDGNFDNFRTLVPTTREEKIQYIQGMFDAEGHIGVYDRPIIRNGKKYVGKDKFLTISQGDHTQLKLWSVWLDELGIENKLLLKDDNRSRIYIRKNDAIKKFAKIIGSNIKRKRDNFDEAIKLMTKSPISKEDKEKLIKIHEQTNFGASYIGMMFDRSKTSVLSLLGRAGFDTSKKKSSITANDIDIAETILGKELPFKIENHRMKKFPTDGLQYSKIKSIKKHSTVKGYDLHTPKYNNFFLGNGILSHNSVLAQQIACYWSYAIWKTYGTEVPFTIKDNIVFNGRDLIKKGNKIGKKHKYGCLVFDEAGADLEGVKAMKKTTQNVKDYMRECGMYNQLIILCLPEFFDLPKGVACNRSNCLIDCYVTTDKDDLWQRGKFNFFSAPTKKKLYKYGKKDGDYSVTKCDFYGDWDNFYTIDEKEYKELKVEALKSREVVSQREETRTSYLKGAFKILLQDFSLTQTEVAERIAEKQKISTNHRFIGRLLAGENTEDDDD